jgi:hypothetical protein
MTDFGKELDLAALRAMKELSESPLIKCLESVPGNAEVSRRFARETMRTLGVTVSDEVGASAPETAKSE